MTAVERTAATEPTVARLGPEWDRIELLAGLLLSTRRGDQPGQELLSLLADLGGPIERMRQDGVWTELVDEPLDDLELDVLAASLAPVVCPRVGALYASLQPHLPEGNATAALIQEMFTLEYGDLPALVDALAPGSPLRWRRLVLAPGAEGDWRQAILPGPGVVERLLGRDAAIAAPPGSFAVPTDAVLSDLVISNETAAKLDEFVQSSRNREIVATWGGRAIGGPVALFTGPSGVGKSIAAQAVASELGWPLFRVDLGSLVSKYIGETEKNLTHLFEASHGRRLVLHFEEAESIFGRRGEIREARDRYANLEVSHLLARVESHDGPCILSSNLRRNIDPAFVRRFHTVIDFPRPDRTLRAKLWEKLLPPGAPLAEDVDTEALSGVELTGGEIRNAAAYACLIAADRASPVSLELLTLGIWREMAKDGRQLALTDLGPLAAHLPDSVRRTEDVA